MTKRLIASDLHLSDRPKDSYRFGIFKWLAEQQRKQNVDETYLLGDLTDRKDNHSSALVNRIIDELLQLRPPIYLLRGNHDGLDPNNPFFRFLQSIEGLEFVVDAKCVTPGVALIPHQPDQASFDRVCAMIQPNPTLVATHQCFDGAIGETGHRLSGFSGAVVRSKRPLRWYSGDVHEPQTLDCGAMYVGAPYHIRFGDAYIPRVILAKNGQDADLHYPCLKKYVLRVRTSADVLAHSELRKGDHVRLIVTLPHEEVVGWAALKRSILDACREMEVQVFGVELEITGSRPERAGVTVAGKSHQEVLTDFCRAEGVPANFSRVGAELLEV